MTCEVIASVGSFADLMIYPTTCDYYFWLKILIALIIIVGWGLYWEEKKRKGEGDFLSSITISSLAFSIVGIFGTLVKGDTGTLAGIPLIQTDILIILFAITIPLIIIWIFRDK